MVEKGHTFDLRKRTKVFGLRIIKICVTLPFDPEPLVIRKQLVRCGTSVGAQYREACRARSPAEFRSKMQSALQELDETAYWLEMLVEAGMVRAENVAGLMREAEELIAIFVASIKTSSERS